MNHAAYMAKQYDKVKPVLRQRNFFADNSAQCVTIAKLILQYLVKWLFWPNTSV